MKPHIDGVIFYEKIFNPYINVVVFITANAHPEDCEIPGKTIHWIADYCIYWAETDDFLNAKVQKCFEANQGFETEDTCKNKK